MLSVIGRSPGAPFASLVAVWALEYSEEKRSSAIDKARTRPRRDSSRFPSHFTLPRSRPMPPCKHVSMNKRRAASTVAFFVRAPHVASPAASSCHRSRYLSALPFNSMRKFSIILCVRPEQSSTPVGQFLMDDSCPASSPSIPKSHPAAHPTPLSQRLMAILRKNEPAPREMKITLDWPSYNRVSNSRFQSQSRLSGGGARSGL